MASLPPDDSGSSTAKPKQWILNAFAMQSPSHLNPGLWKAPDDNGPRYNDLSAWISLAQKLEAAKFHALFFADVLGGYDVYRGPSNLTPTIPAGAQFPINDPLYSIPALAAATTTLGFGVTSSTTYEPPYALARKFSTVDHLTNGRVAWNIVTSYLDSAARNFPVNSQIQVPHDTRYALAHEYLDVCYKLWEGSWRDDATHARYKLAGNYADPSGVRQIEHVGPHFTVPGPHLCEPSPQRTPFLFQAGTSSAGRTFAAQHAEAVFLNGHAPHLVRPSVDSIRAQAESLGRPRDAVKIVAGLLVIVDESDEKAQAKFEALTRYGDAEGALALFGGWSGIDLAAYGDDEDFRFVESKAVQSMVNHWAATVPGLGDVAWTKARIAEFLLMGGNGAKIVGSARTVADELERWVAEADVDGFNLSFATNPGTFDDIIEFLLPELRRRGVFWDDYKIPGGTLRETYTGEKGQRRLPESHRGAKFVWREGEELPKYIIEQREREGNGEGQRSNGTKRKVEETEELRERSQNSITRKI
jgi:FMN-dependent oxidoreductase (nitrilotriacetate monooxygenase family)